MRQRSPLPLIVVSLLVLGVVLTLVRGLGHMQWLELAAYDLLTASVEIDDSLPPAVSLLLVHLTARERATG